MGLVRKLLLGSRGRMSIRVDGYGLAYGFCLKWMAFWYWVLYVRFSCGMGVWGESYAMWKEWIWICARIGTQVSLEASMS